MVKKSFYERAKDIFPSSTETDENYAFPAVSKKFDNRLNLFYGAESKNQLADVILSHSEEREQEFYKRAELIFPLKEAEHRKPAINRSLKEKINLMPDNLETFTASGKIKHSVLMDIIILLKILMAD